MQRETKWLTFEKTTAFTNTIFFFNFPTAYVKFTGGQSAMNSVMCP